MNRLFRFFDLIHWIFIILGGVAGSILLGHFLGMGLQGFLIGFVLGAGLVGGGITLT